MSPQTESPGQSSRPDTTGPALVYFAKAPLPGLVKTRLCPPLSTDEAAALYGAFLRQSVRVVPGARTLVYGWPEEEQAVLTAALPVGWRQQGIEFRVQRGADLWARMRGCFAELLAVGHRAVVIRNTDSPDLELSLVRDAIDRCGPGRVVLGPDRGGGYYLVGLSEAHPELFGPAAEGGEAVFEQTRQLARDSGLEVVELPVQGDVDSFDDLLDMWRRR